MSTPMTNGGELSRLLFFLYYPVHQWSTEAAYCFYQRLSVCVCVCVCLCKNQSVYCSYISYIFLYFCKAPITSYIFAHFLYFPVFFLSLFAQHRILLSIRNFYTTVVSYLLGKFPLSYGLLQDLGCLNPLRRDDPTGIVAIRRVAEKLKCVLPSTLTNLEGEWRVYQLDSNEVPKLTEEYSAAMVKPQSLKETDHEDSDDDMGPESHSAESYISAVAPIFFVIVCWTDWKTEKLLNCPSVCLSCLGRTCIVIILRILVRI